MLMNDNKMRLLQQGKPRTSLPKQGLSSNMMRLAPHDIDISQFIKVEINEIEDFDDAEYFQKSRDVEKERQLAEQNQMRMERERLANALMRKGVTIEKTNTRREKDPINIVKPKPIEIKKIVIKDPLSKTIVKPVVRANQFSQEEKIMRIREQNRIQKELKRIQEAEDQRNLVRKNKNITTEVQKILDSQLSNPTFIEIVKPLLVDDNLPVINWMKGKSLITSGMRCEYCDKVMNWTKCSAALDGFLWKCQTRGCLKCKRNVSVRKDSFFAKSKVKLQKWLHIIYCWCNELREQETCQAVNISRQTIGDFYNFFREVCTRHFERNPIKLGGPGKTIQIQEFIFSNKLNCTLPFWMFCLVEKGSSQGYMEIVDQIDQKTLLPIIERVAKPGSKIEWKNYVKPENNEENTSSLHFVSEGIVPDAVEAYWVKHKGKIKDMRGCRKNVLPKYLSQYMWMERNLENRLLEFCNIIASQYNLKNK